MISALWLLFLGGKPLSGECALKLDSVIDDAPISLASPIDDAPIALESLICAS